MRLSEPVFGVRLLEMTMVQGSRYKEYQGEDSLPSNAGGGITHLLAGMWREACNRGSTLSFRVVSGSMTPVLRVGDLAKVTRVDPDRISIGDIVALSTGEEIMVHRVIGRSTVGGQLMFRHRGDAGVSSDIVSAEAIIGIVSAVEKAGHETSLRTNRYRAADKILGLRLRLVDGLDRARYGRLSIGVRLFVRPVWRICRGLLLCGRDA